VGGARFHACARLCAATNDGARCADCGQGDSTFVLWVRGGAGAERSLIARAAAYLCHYEKRDANAPEPVLKPHTDREDNEITMSVQIWTPDEKLNGPWPIYVHKKEVEVPRAQWRNMPPSDECVEVLLFEGDAVLFLGRKHIHYRHKLKKDRKSSTSLLRWGWGRLSRCASLTLRARRRVGAVTLSTLM
jgi:hypothetical protein